MNAVTDAMVEAGERATNGPLPIQTLTAVYLAMRAAEPAKGVVERALREELELSTAALERLTKAAQELVGRVVAYREARNVCGYDELEVARRLARMEDAEQGTRAALSLLSEGVGK